MQKLYKARKPSLNKAASSHVSWKERNQSACLCALPRLFPKDENTPYGYALGCFQLMDGEKCPENTRLCICIQFSLWQHLEMTAMYADPVNVSEVCNKGN